MEINPNKNNTYVRICHKGVILHIEESDQGIDMRILEGEVNPIKRLSIKGD